MMTDHTFSEKIEQFKEEVTRLEGIAGQEPIEQTAIRLEKLNYAPPVIIPVAGFLRLTYPHVDLTTVNQQGHTLSQL